MKNVRSHNAIQICVRFLTFSAFLVAALLGGCAAEPVWNRSEPDVVLKGFLQSADAQRTELVWNYLGDKTRAALEQEADAFNCSLPRDDAEKRTPHQMLRFGHVISSTREYKKLEVLSSDDQKARVRIVRHNDLAPIDVELIRENHRWTVELPISQKKDL